MKMKKWKRYIIIVAIVFLCIVGGIWQRITSRKELEQYVYPGVLVDTGSYLAHCYSYGTGEKTIVFIAGSGTPCAYTDFYYLQEELGKKYQTISFDHAGFGFSTTTDLKRELNYLVKELSKIIEQLSQNEKVILVAHSLGALEAIGYEQQNPEKVEGIVFLDGGSPQFYAHDSEVKSILLNRAAAMARTVGITRLFGVTGIHLPLYGDAVRQKELPQEIAALDKAMFNHYSGSSHNLSNITNIKENAEYINKQIKIGVPVLVISSDQGGKAWASTQNELCEWSEIYKHITLDHSNHYVHWSNKEEVIKSIDEFLNCTNLSH